MPEKKYYVNIPGTTEPTVLSENDFLAKKDKLYTSYPDANVVEMQDYNQDEEVGDTDFFINIPGSTEPTQMSAKDFAKKRDKLYATYPDVQVSRIRPINFRTTEAAAPSGYQQGVEAVTGGEEEFKMSREKQAALDAKKQRIDDLKAQLDNYNKSASEELAAIPGQQQRVIRESQQMPKRKELEKQLKEAERSYYTDPNYLGQNKVASDQIDKADKELDELIAPIREESKERRSKSPIGAAGGYAMADMPSYDEMLYTAAKNLNKDSKRLYDAPSKYEPIGGAWYNHENKSNGFNQFMKGAGERASEADFWSMGLTGMVDQYALKDVFKKIQNELGGVGELTEANIDEKLSPMEKQLLAAFFRNADAQARRAEDLSNAYQAGRSAVDSAQFMAEFALSGGITGGIGKAALEVAPKSVKTFAKWISKTLAKETPASLTKGAVKLGTDLGKGAINMWFQPGTYKAILEAQNQFDENGNLVNQSKAAWNAILDRGIEVFSESTGDYIPGILGWGASKLGADKLIGKLANTELGKWGRAFYNSDALKTLKAGGWNGYFGEMSEEFIGAALRTATGIDPDAWKEQWDKDNLAVMALSFIPMSVIGGTVSTVKYGVARKNLADSQEQMPAILQNLGFNDEQIAHAMDVTQMSSPEKIRETIKPIVDEMASRGATKADQDALMNYAMAAATVNAYDGFESARVEQERTTARNELEQTYGEFWHGKEGEQTVERVTLPDGKSGYVQNTDETGLMTVKWDDGTTSFTSTDLGAQVESMPMNQYLDGIILSDKQAREAARMQEDAAVARQQFNTLLSQNTSVPMGTQEAQEEGKILTQQDPNTGAITPVRDADGNYTVVTMNGQTKMSENELAAKWGLNLQPKTDQQIEEDEVAQYEASKKRVDAYNTIKPGTKVQAQLEGLEEPVEYEFTHAVYNEETGEVEIKVWDAENEREETLPESAFPDLSQAAAEMSQRTEVAEDTAAENAQAPEDTTPRDYRGKPLPLKDDGSVNQGALWEDSPEAWAAWNDQQRQDGGENSKAYIQAAVKTVEGEVAELQKAYASELDFDRRAAIEQQIAEKTRRAQELNNVLNGYDARAKQAEEAAKAEQAAKQKAEESKSVQALQEQQAAAAEEQRRVPLRARALAWAEKIGVPVDLLETPDQVKDADAVEALKKGLRVAGWYNKASGKVRIYLPNIKDEAEIDKTFIHEVISHKGLADMLGAGYNTLLDHVWNDLMTEAERKKWTKYILDTNPNAKGEALQRAAADEYIADLSERIGLENVNTEELSKWEEFVKMIYNFFLQMMTGDLKITQEDLSDLLVASMARYKEIKENGSAESLMRYAIAANNEEVRFSVRYAPGENEIGQIAADISKQVGVSQKEARKWVVSETSLAATIGQKENQPYLDYTADDRYTAIKQNSDYPQGTVDFNNICRKRLAFTDMYQRIQKAFPNVIITGEDLAKIRNIMKDHNLMVACGLCYVEDRRQLLGEIAKDFIDNYATNFEDYASRGGEAKKKNAEKFRKLIGEDRKDDLSIYDLITLSGAAQLREEHPGIYEAFQAFNNARGQQSGNLFQGYAEYKREILKWSKKKIKNVNDNGGLRIFSYSDFEAHHLIDVVQIIIDCARMGVKIQGYTKVPAFARVVANTGVKLNRSLIPLGDTGMVDGKLAYDPVEGIDVNDPDFLESNDNIGNILIGINDEQIRLAMADPFVHYIIPYHSNQKEVLRSLKQTGAWTNYKNSQTEKDANGKATLINIYTEVIAAAEAEGKPIENERQFTEKFLEVCREKGLTPRFEQFLDRVGGQYVYTPGYYKLLLDFKMFDENGKYLPQQPVVAQFDDAFNTQILNDYVKDEKEKFGENLDDVYNEIVEALGLEGRTPDVQQPKTGDQILGEILESIDRNTEKPGEGNEIRFSIRGFNGVLAAEDIEAEDNLAVAEEMEKAGKDATTIWQATGWEKGADGRWRNEIPDATLKDGVDLKTTQRAGDILDAPELFKSYPELENMPVEIKKLDVVATYDPSKKSIALDKNYNTGKDNEGRLGLTTEGRRSLLHELQHAIQRLEGFAHGSNKSSEEVRYYKEALKDKAIDAYFAWFFSRKNSSRRLNNAGLQGVIRGIESSDLSQWNESDRAELTTLLNHLKGLTSDEYRKLVTRAARFAREAKKAGERGYRNAVGEVEARNVEFRSRLSDKARRASPPSLTEDTSRRNQVIRFRVANEDQKIFISNAEKAVTDLKMDKATPEQWKKTLEKNGGLKAAEDKWLGLSTWLDGLDRKTVTKQEVLDYIAENQIQIEEQRYSEDVDLMRAATEDVRNTIGRGKELEELQAEVDELVSSEEYQSLPDDEAKDDWLLDQMKERYGDDFTQGYFIDEEQKIDYALEPWDVDEKEVNSRIPVRKANSMRLAYTTEGLRNRQEIALTVPTIESWNEGDQIHFGDAGEGRAIAWARFGDTWTSKARDEAEKKYREAEKKWRDYKNEIVAKYALQATGTKSTRDLATDEENARVMELQLEAVRLYNEWKYGMHPREKVLVIDEIQSKRHQEAREQGGYKDDSALKRAEARRDAAKEEYDKYHASLLEKYGNFNGLHNNITPEENAESQRLYQAFRGAENAVARNGFDPMEDEEYRRLRDEQQAHENSPEFKGLMKDWQKAFKESTEGDNKEAAQSRLMEIDEELKPFQDRNRELIQRMEDREAEILREYHATHTSKIPAAPFEKNWHELAMKRMLRYAAENGYDTVAWTTGDQQAERYDLGGVLKDMEVVKYTDGGWRLLFEFTNGSTSDAFFNEEGIVNGGGQFQGMHMSEVVGKELADRIMSKEAPKKGTFSDPSTADLYDIKGDGLRVGGEGMKGFYDDILPRFMNKYGKKWGVKVEDIFLPNLESNGLTMHSVDVTPEMKESVMQGQLMFRKAMEEEYQAAVESGDMGKAQQMVDEAAEAAGYTIRGYHGTTHNFTIFDQGKGNAEGNWGKGFYFTNNLDDAEANYGNEDGPDLQVKIERLAENMEWMDGYEDMDYEQRLEAAKNELTGDDPHVISAAIRMNNPVVFNSRAVGPKETFFDFDSGYNPETDEYEGEESGLLLDFIEAWNDVMMEPEWEANNISPNEILDYADGDGIAASYLEDKAREILDNNGLMDYNGDLASGEFLRQVFERMGFDGIVDANVNIKFGTQRRYGRSMDGMDYGTTHFVAFQPEQIKQSDPVTRDDDGNIIPISKRFDESNPDIRFRITPEQDAEYLEAVNAGDMEKAGKMVKDAAKAAGYDSPKLYHGSDAFGFTRIDTSLSDDRASFWATNKENVAGSYTKLSVTRKPGSEISDEEYEKAVEVADNALDEEIRKFRSLIDKYFSEWFFGDGGNDGIRHEIMGANHIPGYGDGVYDVLEDYVAEAFRDYGEDYEEEYEDFADWEENSPEAQKIFDSISSLEGLRNQLWEIENGDLTGGIYELYANTENMFVVDADGKAWNELHPEGLPKIERGPFKDVPYRTRDVVKWAKENGYDGVIFKNIKDNGQYGRTAPSDVYAFLNPQGQVKSADPVTYDDNGNVIPLSERFNEGNDDIRFRLGSENINAGLNALEKLANGEEVVRDAMSRPDLSQYGADANVAFYWGETGDPSRNYKKGYGIAHMGAKHGPESIFRALDIIDHGDIERYVEGNKTVVLTDGEYEALLALTRSGRRETWLFNGWEKKENAGETSEVSTQSGSTQTNPTFSREDLGAAVSEYKDRINSDNTNSSEEISIADEPMTASAPEVEESAIRFRAVQDPLKVAELEAGEKIPGYRTVVLNPDGSMASPMAGELGVAKAKKSEDRRVKTSSFTENTWNEAEENPDLADENGKIKLIKTDNAKRGLVDVDEVDYNPYNHLRLSPVNLQFKDAWKRPDLIYIKSEVPKSEAVDLRGIKDPAEKDRLSPYHAEKAVLPVGIHDWSGGGELLLSRWDKPVGQVAWEEIADAWANDDKVKEGVQFDRVPPQILDMLVERGIEILPPSKGKDKNEAYKAWKAGDQEAYEAWRDTGKAPKKDKAPKKAENEQASDNTVFRIAYHGSPNEFEEFDTNFVGDGEGHQSHGWGIYVSLEEGTARRYGYLGDRDKVVYQGQEPPTYYAGEIADFIKMEMAKGESFENSKQRMVDMLKRAEENRKNSGVYWMNTHNDKEIEFVEGLTADDFKVNESHRNLYTVDIPDDTGENYIDEQKNLKKPMRVRIAEAIRALPADAWRISEDEAKLFHDYTAEQLADKVEKGPVDGEKVYAELSHGLGSPRAASEFLSNAGFVGIKYVGGVDGPCAVIFDAKDVEIDDHTRFRVADGMSADDLVKRVQDYGLRGILDEDAAKAFWADAYAVMPEDARRQIVDQAFNSDADKEELNIRRYTRQYVADLAKKGYAEDESGLLRYLADKIKAELGQDLDENTLRYLIWRSANRYASNNILDMAEDIAMRRRLGVGEFNGQKFPTGVSEATEEAENRIDEAENEREEERNEIRRTAPRTPFAALNRAMTAQRKYDQETVASIVALAKDMIKKGNIDKVSAREMARLMTIIKDANGRKPATVKAATLQLLDFMVDHTVGKEKELLDKMLKVRTAKVREPGVDTIAKLDLRAQNIINNFRDNYQLSEAEIDKLITELEDKMADGRRTDASLEDLRSQLEGLQLAKQYAADIAALDADIKAIRQQMKDAKDEFDELSAEEKKKFRTALNEELAAGEEMIRAKKIQQVDAYRRLRGDIAKAIDEGAERAKTFLEAERERVEQIHHWANSDMQGVSADVRDRKLTGWAKFANSSFAKLFTAPLANLDQMLRTLGRKSPEGRGYLWNWMMGAVRNASDTEKLGIDAAEKKLNDKVSEIFDEPGMEWNDLYSMERKMPKAKMRYFSANGEWVEEELTQGNLLYIYMVNKMTDGRMKLRQMNITDETVEDIKKALDPRFVELADWIQEEFLPNLRDRYNETHKRLFGTSMASIENYFPLRILGGVIEEKRNVGDQEQKTLPTDITGAIIKRTVNAKQLNLAGTDAFSLVVEHVREMEHWNAYAEASRDFSTLLKYKRFQNQLKQLNTIYGAGKDLMNLFWDTVNLSVGAFRPTTTPTDKAFLNLAKGVTAAKISFRAYTAIKQILSWPAFLADTNPLILGKNTLPINWKKNWDWAMENLPNFKKRVESRKAGLDILEDTSLDSKFWGTDFAKWINQNGMFMNAFVDALTVSIGARSVYETKKARYLKEGFSEEEADKKAKMDAEVLYNETQQSSEKEFMSTMQAHRTVANVALSAYRNSSMGYQRQLHQALRTLGRMARKGYKSEAIEYMTKQLEREGLSTEDAEKAAINRYERAGWQALVRVAVFGWLVQFAWNLGAHAVYLLFGDDPDEKKNMLVEDATHALIGGPIEGLAAGNIMSEAFNMIKNGENLRNWDPTTLPIMSDIKSTISKMSSDPVAGANDLVYLAAQIGLGTNPQTISDAIVAIVDACNGDFETAREVMFCIMRILAVPQSQLDQLMIDEIGMKAKDARELSYEDVARRYVDYKMSRNAPVTGPLYSDELREKREKSLNTTFKKKVNERKKLKEEE